MKNTTPTLPTYTVGNRTFTILFPELLRPLEPDERKVLADGVRAHGVQVAVIVDEEDGVIDGGHRVEVAATLGLGEIPVSARKGLTLEQKADLAVTLNHARRHLNKPDWRAMKDQRGERIAVAARMATEGMSTRTIAAKTGVSEKRVRDDLQDATAKGYAVEPKSGKVKGKDGKSRTVKKKRQAPAPQQAPSPVVPLDGVGLPVPKALREVFERDAGMLDHVVSMIRHVERLVNDLAARPGGDELKRRLQLIERDGKQTFRLDRLHDAAHDVKFCRPYAACCPYCHKKHPGRYDEDCKTCHGRGWVTKYAWDTIPDKELTDKCVRDLKSQA